MATLEKVMQMQEQGISEPQIISLLRQEGIKPKEINDALTQAKIKSTVGNNRNADKGEEYDNMRPSIVEGSNPKQQDPAYNEPEDYENYPQQQNYQQQEYYQDNQRYYPEYQVPAEGSPTDIALINDIAEQIVEEKSIELKKQVAEFKKFENETRLEIDRINNQLMKIENTLYELQIAIIRKIGEYGENIKDLKNEMSATQESFSKILNPLTDNIKKLQEISNTKPKNQNQNQDKPINETPRKSKPKDKDDIEKFIR